MAEYPITGSSLNKKITAGLSTLITIKVGNNPVGALQAITIDQSRPTVKWQEIGTDGFVENHPKNAAEVTADVTRIVFDGLSMTEAFSRGFFNLQAQRIPFDILIIDRQPGDDNLAVVHTLHSCWFTKLTKPYKSDDYLITESASVDCLRITTSRMGESAATGGIRGVGYDFDTIERKTDTRGIPGRFNSAGSTFSKSLGVDPIITEAKASGGKNFGPGQI